MNLLIFDETEFQESIVQDDKEQNSNQTGRRRGIVNFTDRRHEHIRKVLKSSPGDTLRVGLLDGPMGVGVVKETSKVSTTVEVALSAESPDPPDTDLILALPRPIMLRRVLSQAATLGTGRIFLINSGKVEKSFFDSGLIQDSGFREHLIHGLEQGMDTRLPRVSIHRGFKPFVEDLLPDVVTGRPEPGSKGNGGYAHLLIAHPECPSSLAECTGIPLWGRVLMVIGPEGGWTEYEVSRFTELGFKGFNMGPRILRVDTAVPVLLAQLNLLRQIEHRSD